MSEARVRALRAEGLSVREIARELGLSRSKVHRIVSSAPAAPEIVGKRQFGALRVVPSGEDFVPGDGVSPAVTSTEVPEGPESLEAFNMKVSSPVDGEPLVSLLSESDMAVLGVSETDLAGLYGDELVVYRMLGMVHAEEAVKARAAATEFPEGTLSAEARARLSGRAWVEWLLQRADGMVPQEYLGPGGPVPNSMRDARIVELRRSNWTLAAIAEEVGMSSKAAVSQALSRIACELERPALVGPRLGRHPGPSEDW